MKRLLRNLILHLPLGNRVLAWYGRFRLNQMARSYPDAGEFFSHIYRTNLWGSEESASGPGSTLEYTKNLRQQLPALFRQLEAESLLDAPCGDYNWFSHVERPPSLRCFGADIVPELVARNQRLYGNETTSFAVLDIRSDALPQVDLWLCRDALFHFSNRDVFLTIQNFLNSGIPYLLTSSHSECLANDDIPTGSFRQLNLERAPFNFCRPEQYIDDWIAGYPVRKLCLWKREELRRCLEANSAFISAIRPQAAR